jgi:hypothetical protein
MRRQNTSPAFFKALIFAAIGAGVQFIAELALIQPLFGFTHTVTMRLAASGAVGAGLFGFLAGWNDIYSFEPRAVWAFILDVSWSAINTLTGLVWMIWCAAKGTFLPPTAETRKRGIIVFSGAALPGAAATTLGTVVGGEWLFHEGIHVQQARIFGPLYWPIYFTSYLVNFAARVLTFRFHDIHWEAYGRNVMEDWAYRAARQSDATVAELAPTIKWASIAVLNGLALVVLLAPLAGLVLIPWWTGLIVIFGYAIARSFRPPASP